MSGDPTNGDALQRLLAIMRQLRDRDTGCPWDLQQDYASLAPYTLEEASEVVDALERGHIDDLRDELGDLLFQVVFLSQLATEDGRFDFQSVARGIGDKLVSRHPHVFARDVTAADSAEVLRQWEGLKAEERAARGVSGALDGVPLSLPALVRASKIGKRAARVGFDWPDAAGARRKVDEELAELDEALQSGDSDHIDEELGDLLFAMVSWSRLLGRDPERLLRAANRKFERRFGLMEAAARERGLALESLTPEAWDALWEAAKRAPRGRSSGSGSIHRPGVRSFPYSQETAMSSRILSVVAISGLGLASTLANAGDWHRDDDRRYRNYGPDVDMARVVDVTPIVERVRYREPVEQCYDVARVEPRYERNDRTGATIAGGLLGAVIGHQFGSGGGRRAATVAGAVLGGAVANNASARADARDDDYGYDRRDRVSYETQCRVRDEARYEERIRAYRVTYRYHGREYTTEMPYDPGPRLRVAVDARPL